MIAKAITDSNAVLAFGTMQSTLSMIMQTTTNSFKNSGEYRFRPIAILSGHNLLVALWCIALSKDSANGAMQASDREG